MKSKRPRVTVVTGHYGSGKTEISLNLALSLAHESPRESGAVLADLDIINPYFRSREKRIPLEEGGVSLIGGSLEDQLTGVPSLSGAVRAQLNQGKLPLILDTGGDPEGARLLARYPEEWARLKSEGDLEVLFVINPFRPETSKPDLALTLLRKIESESGLSITGLAANGHMLAATASEHIRAGYDMAREVSRVTALPLRFCTLPRGVSLPDDLWDVPTLPLTLLHRADWMAAPKD